jgi:uncharacterized protein
VSTTAVIAKSPLPGHVKTRLCPPLTFEQAACVAEAALCDTLCAVADVPGRHVVALDGEPGGWLPDGFEVTSQGTGGLGDRLAFVFRTIGVPAVVIAMDTPQVTPDLLARAHELLTSHDIVLAPTLDGGYWLIGMSMLRPEVFDNVVMSSASTYSLQVAQANRLRLTIAELPMLRDVDDWDDAVAVAAEIPDRQFGAAVAALR